MMIAQQLEQDQWVYMGYGHWQEFPYDHVKAVTYRKAQDGTIPMFRARREQEFRVWMDKRNRMLKQRNTLTYRMVNFKEPVVNLYKVLSPEYRDCVLYGDEREEHIRPQFVALKNIIPTQEDVNQELVNWYTRSGYTYDPDGDPPFAVRFLGDEEVYLTNGHHRYARNVQSARGNHALMFLHVDELDMTFEEACGKLESLPFDIVNLFTMLLLEGVA